MLEYDLDYKIVGKKFLKQVLASYSSFDTYVNLIELLYGEYVAKEFVKDYEGDKQIFWLGENEKLINNDGLFSTVLFQMYKRTELKEFDVRNDEEFWKRLCLYFGVGRKSDCDGFPYIRKNGKLINIVEGYKSFDNGKYWFVKKDIDWDDFVSKMRVNVGL